MQEPAQPTQPMSMNMDGWAAMTENLGTQNAAAVAADAAPVQNPFLTETGTQMNSIAGWQAIAADVSPHALQYLTCLWILHSAQQTL